MQTQDRVKALAFGVVLVGWALVKLGPAAAGGNSVPNAAPAAAYPAAEARQAPASNEAIPSPASVSATELSPSADGATAVPIGSLTARTPGAVSRELELQARLEAAARAYTRALLAGDAATIKNLLAERCGDVDAAILIERRRASLGVDLGVAIRDTTASAPLVGHFDAVEGVAHAFLGFESAGRQLFPRTIDGWLYESGHWRNAECME